MAAISTLRITQPPAKQAFKFSIARGTVQQGAGGLCKDHQLHASRETMPVAPVILPDKTFNMIAYHRGSYLARYHKAKPTFLSSIRYYEPCEISSTNLRAL